MQFINHLCWTVFVEFQEIRRNLENGLFLEKVREFEQKAPNVREFFLEDFKSSIVANPEVYNFQVIPVEILIRMIRFVQIEIQSGSVK